VDAADRDPQFLSLLESAAHLQRLVPGAILVGGSAAILYADHRESRDHDHVLADLAHLGIDRAADVLGGIDDYYSDQRGEGDGIASQLVRQLSDPQPANRTVTEQLPSYRRLRKQWSDWGAVTQVLGEVAAGMVDR
jgi:hypothetical protein